VSATVSERVRALNRAILEVWNVQTEHRLQGRVGGDLVAQVELAAADVGFAETWKNEKNNKVVFYINSYSAIGKLDAVE
jgi:hypothetical protein